MIANFSLLFLTIRGSFYSPFISPTQNSYSNTHLFNNINIRRIFNSFLYTTVGSNAHFSYSTFSSILNSAIFIDNADQRIESDQIFVSQTFIPISDYMHDLKIDNCCFLGCSSTDLHSDGGAINIEWFDTTITINNTIFYKCTSKRYGGAIYSPHSANIYNSIFSNCESTDRGSILSLNRQLSNSQNIYVQLYQVLFTSSSGKHTPIDLNCTQIYCKNSNVTYNKNIDHNSPDSTVQYCCGFSYVTQLSQQSQLSFINLNGNDGDFVIDIEIFYQYPPSYINIFDNINLNFFLQFSPDTGPQSYIIYKFDYLTFFENKANSQSGKILIANDNSIRQFTLENCFFEYSEQEVNSMLNGHYIMNCFYDQTKTSFTQDVFLVKPSLCAMDSDVFTMSNSFTESLTFSSSNYFTNSRSFSYSEKFTSSSLFSPSEKFTSSSTFSPSEKFTPTSIFSHSKSFTSSLLFSPSEPFTASSAFTQSSPFTESLTLMSLGISLLASSHFTPSSNLNNRNSLTGTFTASSPFTPSNFFTPNRTKVPDPQNIFNADVTGQKKPIFSKEEMKKAAAPISILVIIIIVSVVFSIFYLRRKIYDLKHSNSVPDFDTSFGDEIEEDDSSYSYSFYTYTYTYDTVSASDSQTESYYLQNENSVINYDYSDFTYSDTDEYDYM